MIPPHTHEDGFPPHAAAAAAGPNVFAMPASSFMLTCTAAGRRRLLVPGRVAAASFSFPILHRLIDDIYAPLASSPSFLDEAAALTLATCWIWPKPGFHKT